MFPTLKSLCVESELGNSERGKFNGPLRDLSIKFDNYFPAIDDLSSKLKLFTSPFTIDPYSGTDCDGTLAEEVIGLQCNSSSEDKQKTLPIEKILGNCCRIKRISTLNLLRS